MTYVSHATMGSKPMKPSAAQSMGSKSMKPTASAKPMPATAASAPTVAAASATTVAAASATTATPSGECRDVRHQAERANRNARCQNSYCFLLHGAFPNRTTKSHLCSQRSRTDLTNLTLFAAASFEMAKSRFH
jgi:hypothetical protein